MRFIKMIDWNLVITNLKDGRDITVDPSRWNMDNPEYTEILKLWKDNNFNTDSVKWTNFYNTSELAIEIAKEVGITPLRSWISCVEPGYMTGYHYDIDDNENEYLKHGTLKRYSVFISEPNVGHLFILGKEYFYNKPQGTILKWGNYRDWHNGINGSLSKKYMFHIIGY
jgi:hypothetical protein